MPYCVLGDHFIDDVKDKVFQLILLVLIGRDLDEVEDNTFFGLSYGYCGIGRKMIATMVGNELRKQERESAIRGIGLDILIIDDESYYPDPRTGEIVLIGPTDDEFHNISMISSDCGSLMACNAKILLESLKIEPFRNQKHFCDYEKFTATGKRKNRGIFENSHRGTKKRHKR